MINRLTVEEGAKDKLSPEEVKSFNDWEYRKANGGRTHFPSRLTEEDIEKNVLAIKEFSEQNKELEKRFYDIQNFLDSKKNAGVNKGLLIIASIFTVVGIFFPPAFIIAGIFWFVVFTSR